MNYDWKHSIFSIVGLCVFGHVWILQSFKGSQTNQSYFSVEKIKIKMEDKEKKHIRA